MKIVLLGASGLLGAAFARAAKRRKHETIGIVGKYPGQVDGLAKQLRMDLRDSAALERYILDIFPDAIVNCAAISAPKECIAKPEDSLRLNIDLPEQLSKLARHLFTSFIHVSSEQVFDGSNAPYTTDSTPNPVNPYASQKREAEERIVEIAQEFATIVRIPLLNGNSLIGTRSLHEALLNNWANERATTLFEDEIRQPCLADNAAEMMVELCERQDLKGIHHWAGTESLSRYDIGKRIQEHFGLPDRLVEKALRGDKPEFADRQPDLSLDLKPLSGLLKTQPQSLQTQLEALIVPVHLRDWYNSI